MNQRLPRGVAATFFKPDIDDDHDANKQNFAASSTPDLQREVAELLVECLNLEDISADQIEPDAPLFGDGLGMDSIDVLEVALSVGKKYGVQLKADSPDNARIFGSLRQLSDHIAAQRTR